MNLERFIEVYEFAKEAHKGQNRKTGEPYITHPVAVAEIAREYDADSHVIYACLLHDVVEDTAVKLREIKKRFGREVAFLVDGVTKDKTSEKTFRKVERYAKKDKRVILIKLADRIHNVRTSNHTDLANMKRKYKKSNPWYISLGRELGYEELASQLEELTDNLI